MLGAAQAEELADVFVIIAGLRFQLRQRVGRSLATTRCRHLRFLELSCEIAIRHAQLSRLALEHDSLLDEVHDLHLELIDALVGFGDEARLCFGLRCRKTNRVLTLLLLTLAFELLRSEGLGVAIAQPEDDGTARDGTDTAQGGKEAGVESLFRVHASGCRTAGLLCNPASDARSFS